MIRCIAALALCACGPKSETSTSQTTPPPEPTPEPAPEAWVADPERGVPADPGDGPCMDVTLADLDGDDDLDVVLALEGPANAVLVNDGAGTLSLADTPAFRTPTDAEQAQAADLDGDGCVDLYFANEDLGGVDEWYRGDCALGFVDASESLPASTPVEATAANAVQVADLDGDGWLDLLIGHRGQSAWWRGSAEGWIDATDRLPADSATTQDVALADLDADGDLDVVLANEGRNAVWRNDGGTFVDASGGLGGDRETRSVAVLDADGDGVLDLVFGNVGWTGRNPQSQLLLGDGTLRFDNATTALPEETFDTIQWLAQDLDGDGDPDLMGAQMTHSQAGLQTGPWVTWRNDDGAFVDATEAWLPEAPEGFGTSVALGDLDGDGFVDAYLCGRASPDQVLFGVPS
ncbi:MAG: VCBS repeat-containing protein [Myxococcales bacterium]|nr:VCBS repeat-containing protein [Myxococcales bacterium]